MMGTGSEGSAPPGAGTAPQPGSLSPWDRWKQAVTYNPGEIDYPNNNPLPGPFGPNKILGTLPDGRTIVLPRDPLPEGFLQVPPDGAVCHQYPANVLNLPPLPQGYRTPEDLAAALGKKEFTLAEIDPKEKWRVDGTPIPYTVYQLGREHVGIAGPDGKIYDFTMAAPNMGVNGQIHGNNSANDFWNATHGGRQPYSGLTLNQWTPPSNFKPPNLKDPPLRTREPPKVEDSLMLQPGR